MYTSINRLCSIHKKKQSRKCTPYVVGDGCFHYLQEKPVKPVQKCGDGIAGDAGEAGAKVRRWY